MASRDTAESLVPKSKTSKRDVGRLTVLGLKFPAFDSGLLIRATEDSIPHIDPGPRLTFLIVKDVVLFIPDIAVGRSQDMTIGEEDLMHATMVAGNRFPVLA